MSTERQARIEAAFHSAADLPADQRQMHLESVFPDDPAAVAEVTALLAADEGDSLAVDRILGSPRALSAETLDSRPDRVGAYLIEKEISRGGMGRVFLGRRADREYESQVAIKLMRVDRKSEWAEARFREERQILASLSHPNIATLLDGGTTDSGEPYVVMQYIDGMPVNEYCRSHDLSLRARLRLFVKICGAVSHAHRNLVIHRDIKPGNILVDPEGDPKLLDFGIAKLMTDGDSGDGSVTSMGLMTPAYASPEQVRGEGVSTSTDIYSLGVLLFEMLAGQPPFEVRSSTPAEIVKAVCDTQPVPPSTRAASSQRAREIKGDLDNIVLKAMQKEPARRYGSAGELSADVQNYLENRPVSARADSAFYLLGKFVRRHAWGVAAAAVFIVSLAAVVSFYTLRLSEQRDRAVAAEMQALDSARLAEREASTATKVSEFLTGLFEAVDPRAGIKGKDLTARDLLDVGARSLEENLNDEPATKAHLWRTIGLAYSHMGSYEPGVDALRQSLQWYRREGEPLQIAEALNRLAEVLRQSGTFDEAVTLHREAIKIREATLTEPTWGLADSYNNFGLLLYETGQYDEAQSYLENAITTHRAAAGGDNSSVAINMHNLTLILRVRAEYPEAERMIQESLRINAASGGGDSASYVVSLQQLGRIQNDRGHYQDALATMERVMNMAQSHYEPDNPRMAAFWSRIANSHHALGDYEQALALYQRSMDIYAGSQGPDGWNEAYVELYKGRLLTEMERWNEAESALRHTVQVRRTVFVDGHYQTALAEAELGALLTLRGKFEEAGVLLAKAVQVLSAGFSDDHPELARVRVYLARLHRLSGNADDAVRLLDQSAGVLQSRRQEMPLVMTMALAEKIALLPWNSECVLRQSLIDEIDRILAGLSEDHPMRNSLPAACET